MLRTTLDRVLPALALATAIVSALPVARAAENPSGPAGKGAQVYCFMRNSGNNHEVSWLAAYALIKRQSASLFKTSPEHAAVMITEAVVQNPGSFPDCGKYLGDLYASAAQEQQQQREAATGSSSSSEGGTTRSERYAY
ncbi:DUF6554 family protein [Vulcanococcus sp.]|uniref:DUF6554 family protein n=1 Tax=Vulcanococcus sp. TaxID=2856995 RepID=UPI0037D9C6DE